MTQPVQVLNLVCNKCGASLHVKPGTQYVTCGYCGSQLQIHEDGGSLYTEVLNRIESKATHIEKGVEIIRLQNELERLDREYQNEKLDEKATRRGTENNENSFSPVGVIGGVVTVIGIMIVLAIIFANNGPSASPVQYGSTTFYPSSPEIGAAIPCVAVLAVFSIIGGATYAIIKGMDQATAKEQRDELYQRRRRQLIDEIERQNQQT